MLRFKHDPNGRKAALLEQLAVAIRAKSQGIDSQLRKAVTQRNMARGDIKLF